MRAEVESVSADKSDVLEDGVAVVVSLTVGKYSAAEIEGTGAGLPVPMIAG